MLLLVSCADVTSPKAYIPSEGTANSADTAAVAAEAAGDATAAVEFAKTVPSVAVSASAPPANVTG
jgi:hypothetical protein